MKTLDMLPKEQCGIIDGLDGDTHFLGRITAMGFTPNAEVSVVRNGKSGPLLVDIRGTLVAVGRGEARKIRLKEAV